jgi:hypothetical protein
MHDELGLAVAAGPEDCDIDHAAAVFGIGERRQAAQLGHRLFGKQAKTSHHGTSTQERMAKLGRAGCTQVRIRGSIERLTQSCDEPEVVYCVTSIPPGWS